MTLVIGTTGKAEPANRLTLWYNKPASFWEEALPLGNGHLGAMVYGSVAQDTIQLNEDTFWSGSPYNNYNTRARGVLWQVRSLLANGQYEQGQRLAMDNWNSPTANGLMYESVGRLLLTFPGHRLHAEAAKGFRGKDATSYRRQLDLNTALATTTYTIDGVEYTRRVFTSLTGDVTLIHITASKPSRISLTAAFAGPQKADRVTCTTSLADNRTLLVCSRPTAESAESIPNKLECYTYIRVLPEGGKTKATSQKVRTSAGAAETRSDAIEVSKANAVTIVISSATNFVSYDDISGDGRTKALATLNAFGNRSFDDALAENIREYQKQFGRVSLDLGTTPQADKDTETRIREFATADDPDLVSTYFQFGRYLLIASSQPGTQPANLQGIWNPDERFYPAWDSKYTTNINLEMNYWPADPTNLGELQEPMFKLIEDVSRTGSETAAMMYDCRGWTLHHNTDIWRSTGAVDNNSCGIWPTCNAWFCQHLWEHYLFTGDKQFLAKAYPIMKGASQFYQDFLWRDPRSGYMVASPSTSPENNPGLGHYINEKGKRQSYAIFGGVTMDNSMIYDLLYSTARAARTLGIDKAFADSLDTLKAQLPPFHIGKYGQVQEWLDDWDREFTSHRHMSHLWGAFPGSQVSAYRQPQLFNAVHKSLVGRGDKARGWAMGWKVCMWARMLDGDHAMQIMRNLFTLISPNADLHKTPDGGTYANMFDAHPPFQIDGNFGCTTGIAEMLVQSHDEALHLLPALPTTWGKGEVKGLCARGGFVIDDMKWKDGRLQSVTITSRLGGNLRLRVPNRITTDNGTPLKTAEGTNPNPLMQPYELPAPVIVDASKITAITLPTTYVYDFPTLPGKTYTFSVMQ